MLLKKPSAPLLLALILCTNVILAQQFSDGFIIDEKGKYTYGTISFGDDPRNGCMFKLPTEVDARFLGTNEIAGFGRIDENPYKRKTMQSLDGDKTVFMKELVDGLIKLYTFDGHYYVDRVTAFVELKTGSGEVQQSRAILADIVKEVPKLKRRALRTSMDDISLIVIVSEFNIWATGVTPTRYKKLATTLREPTKIEIGVLSGVDKTNLLIEGAIRSRLNGSYADISGLNGGVSFRYAPSKLKFLSFQTGLEFHSVKMRSVVGDQDYEFTYRILSDIYITQIPLSVQVDPLKKGRLNPFIIGGFRISLSSETKFGLEEDHDTGSEIYINRYNDNNIKSPAGFFYGIGIRYPLYKKINLSSQVIRWTGNTNFSDDIYALKSSSLKIKSLIIQLGVSYAFQKK